MRIEQAAAKKQARIDNKTDIIVGLNAHQLKKEEKQLDILEIDNTKVRQSQVKRINKIKKNASKSVQLI